MKQNIIINWHYYKLMTINNSVTNAHQMEMYGYAFPMSLWNAL